MKHAVSLAALVLGLGLSAPVMAAEPAAPASVPAAVTVADADAFVQQAEKQLLPLSEYVQRASWVNATYITDDTDFLAARAGAEMTQVSVNLANGAARFNGLKGLSYDTSRKLDMLRSSIVAPASTAPGAAEELNAILTRMSSAYGKGKGLYKGTPTSGNDLEELMGTVRDPAALSEMWTSWHDIGAPMKADYVRFVQLSNAGAEELGYADTGAMWRAGYDMSPEEFAALTDKLWEQVQPLYNELHCYTRTKLNEKYGDSVQPATGPIRADLLGNMWAQEWGNIYPIVAPEGAGDIGYDLTNLLVAKNYTPEKIIRTAEGFFTSLGLAPLPETFWSRSQITRPRDREVICHASAWDLDNVEDLRIKMCTKVNADDFVTAHHELGHNYYQRAYNKQPYLYLNGANDGFHEAIGDFIALSVTPDYLVKIGLLDRKQVPSADKDIGLLLREAMDKVAFLPFGLLMDKWRWGVFAGQTKPEDYTKSWNALRLQYQGIVPPTERGADTFDPGAKYHIPGNTPYARYFLARILQFQFHKAACDMAGWKGPLHRCSIYGNKKVGAKFNKMMEMGASRPWPEALQAFTGTREMDGRAMIAYFQPLMAWLQTQNKGKPCGWQQNATTN